MLRRAVFILAALLCLITGGAVVYLFMSIPNDLRAESLLAEARTDLQTKDRDSAQQKLTTIVRDYPRTDAAAAASFALFRLANDDNRELRKRMELLEKRNSDTANKLNESSRKLEELSKVPPPAPTPAKASPATPAAKRLSTKRPATKSRATSPRRSTRRKRRADLARPQDSFHLNSDYMAMMRLQT